MSRRSFTIIETVLAAALSSMVVLGCLGGFMAISRADRSLTARFHEANDLARIQRTMQRAFSTLLMAPTSPLEEEEVEEQPPVEEAVEEEESLEAEVIPVPRIVLEADNDPLLLSLLQSSRFAAGGGGSSIATPQRLELVLSAVPIRPPATQSTVWTQALVGVDDLDEPISEDEEQYTGVRGAFVLRPDDAESMQSIAREVSNDERIGWTLWWQPIDTRSEPARIASGLAACQFLLYRDREMTPELLAYSPEEMPTYIQLEIETLSGLYANYLFEVVWTVDQLEEEEQTAADAGGGGGQAGGGQGAGGNGQGGPGGGRGGGRGEDGDPRARPRPNAPQPGGPGRQIDGQQRPQRIPPSDGTQRRPPGDGGPGNGGRGGGGPGGGGNRGGGGGS